MGASRSKSAIVFVHGLNSSGQVWNPMDELLQEDTELPEIATYQFEYHTSFLARTLTKRLPSLDDVADQLATYLALKVAEQDLALVTHSQGGLVALRYISRHLETLDRPPKLGALIMYACPNAGSPYAWNARRWVFPNHPQERSLKPLDSQTADSIRRVRSLVDREDHPLGKLRVVAIAGASDAIVPPASAKGSWSNVKVVSGDHSSVIRPTSRDSLNYRALQAELRRLSSGPPQGSSPSFGLTDDATTYWLDLANDVSARLNFNQWDAAVGGLVRTTHALPSSVLTDFHEFGAWMLTRIYPPGCEELVRALCNLHSVLMDLLNTFNKDAEVANAESENPWVRVTKWYKKDGSFNPRYHEDLQDYIVHVNLLADLTLELTRAAHWFCDQVRKDVEPSWRLKQGGFLVEGGPYSSGHTEYHTPRYTDAERGALKPYPGLEGFLELRRTRDIHVGGGVHEDAEGE